MEDQIFELLEKMYVEFSHKFEAIDKRFETIDERFEAIDKRFEAIDEKFETIDKRFDNLEQEIKEIKKTVTKIECEHGKKLSALFDGYKQNSDKLDRIENEVSKHEEIILRRIR